MKNINLKNFDYKQFIRFGIIGCMNTTISYVVNVVVLFILSKLKVPFDYMIANIAAYIAGTIWAYIGNKYFVFKVESTSKKEDLQILIKMILTYAFSGIILNNVLSFIWIDLFHISKYIAPIINLVVTVPINFILNKLWAFRKKEKTS